MADKHTEGPWVWVKSRDYGYTALINPDTGVEVLTTGGINDGDDPITWMGEEMTDDDLALIAAAPDLLEVAQIVVDTTKASRKLNAPQLRVALAMLEGVALDAITKAEGIDDAR
tara:strand:+ start:360 stop:701 length:342 start_codon:yes stop_codon:yes gene_type:complete